MKVTVAITSVLFLAVIAASVFYFRGLNRDQHSRQRPFTHIPGDAVILASFRNDETTSNLFSGYQLFGAIVGNNQLAMLRQIHEAAFRKDGMASFLADQEIVFSIHPGKSQVDLLVVVPMADANLASTMLNQLEKVDTTLIAKRLTNPDNRLQLQFPEGGKPIFIGQIKESILLSFTEDLLNRALNDTQPKLTKKTIEQFRSEDLKNTPLTLYINHSQLGQLATTLMRHSPGNFLRLTEGISGQSALKMNFNSNALMFSGNSSLDNSAGYLSLYTTQEPVTQQIKQWLPADVANCMLFGISDYPLFHRGVVELLSRRSELPQMQEQHRIIHERSSVSIQSDLLPEWGDEFAIVELPNRESFGIIKIKDSLAFSTAIQRISTPYPENLYRLNHSNILYYSFGDPLKPFSRPYYLLIDNYFIFSNHTGTLRRYKADYDQRNMLTNTPDYAEFDRLQANEANVSVFVHNKNGAGTIARQLKAPFESAYSDDDNFGYGQFYAWSLQLSGASGAFFSSIYAPFVDKAAPGVTPDWSFDLRGRLVTAPAVFQYDDTSKFILAQAANNILYALSPLGEQLWNAQLPGPILGKVRQLPDSTLVLNTKDRLYRFDSQGDPLPGFSMPLPHTASGGVSVCAKDGHIRIFVPAGMRILAFDSKGEALDGWQNKSLDARILHSLKQATVQDTHYVIAATEAGQVYFFTCEGRPVRHADETSHSGFRNPLSVQSSTADEAESRVLTTDTSGVVRSFSFNGDQQRRNVGTWSADHYFEAMNIVGDSIPELIFADGGELAVYNGASEKLIYNYDFGQRILRPVFFYNTTNKYRVGVATAANHLLYVFEEDGTLAPGFPTEGLPPFYYGTLTPGGPIYLLVGKADRKLYAYRF